MILTNDVRGNIFMKDSDGLMVDITAKRKVELQTQMYDDSVMVYIIKQGTASVKIRKEDENGEVSYEKILLDADTEITSATVDFGLIHWVELKTGAEMSVYRLLSSDQRRKLENIPVA